MKKTEIILESLSGGVIYPEFYRKKIYIGRFQDHGKFKGG
jgi:hypothetical protein